MADDSQPPDDAVSDERYLDDYVWWWLSSDPLAYSPNPMVPLPDCDLFRSALEKHWIPSKPPSRGEARRLGKKKVGEAMKKEKKRRERMMKHVYAKYIFAKTAPGKEKAKKEEREESRLKMR